MEQRSCARSSFKLPILLDKSDFNGIRCASRDIGMGGMFLEVSSAGFSRGESVTVIFTLPTAEGERNHSLEARVARISKDGIGLVFGKPDTATFRTLQELLRFSKTQKVH